MTYSLSCRTFIKVCGNSVSFLKPLKDRRNTTADKYLDKYFQKLQKGLENEKLFSTQQVGQLLQLKSNSIWQILSRLVREGKVHRVSRGRYTISTQLPTRRNPPIEESSRKLIDLLQAERIQFTLTGLDLLLDFAQHQPETIFHLIYTPGGTGDWVQSTLRGEKFLPLLEPRLHETENAVASTDQEVVIIREKQSPIGSQGNLATKERAFVDLYFESTRRLIPFPIQEVAYIFENMRSTSTMNNPQLLRYAHERKIDSEIEAILSFPKGKHKAKGTKLEPFLKSLGSIR